MMGIEIKITCDQCGEEKEEIFRFELRQFAIKPRASKSWPCISVCLCTECYKKHGVAFKYDEGTTERWHKPKGPVK